MCGAVAIAGRGNGRDKREERGRRKRGNGRDKREERGRKGNRRRKGKGKGNGKKVKEIK
jgi:hypothetical protein